MIDADYIAAPLKDGTIVSDTTIKSLICSSFSGYTYLCTKKSDDNTFIVQEYFPNEISLRDIDQTALLLLDESVSNDFEVGLSRFLELAKTLLTIPNKNKVLSFTELNDTAYYALKFDFRCTYRSIIESGKRVPGENIEHWLINCLNYLDVPHKSNLFHFGIQTDSILIDANGDAILVGFNSVGAAFDVDTNRPEYDYLPIERLRNKEELLPVSDFYSLAAILLHGMTGVEPIHAIRRNSAVGTDRPDPLTEQFSQLTSLYDEKLLSTLQWMLSPQPEDRPQTVDEILVRLNQNSSEKKFSTPKRKSVPRTVTQKTEPQLNIPKLVTRQPNIEVPVVSEKKSVAEVKSVPPKEEPSSLKLDTPTTTDIHERTPQNWFQDDSDSSLKVNVFSTLVNTPITWIIIAFASILLAWWWLGTEEGTISINDSPNDVPSINVVAREEAKITDNSETEQNSTQTQEDISNSSNTKSTPTIILQPESNISEIGDAERAERFAKLAELERRVEPYLVEANAHMQNNRLIEPENGNAFESFSKTLSIDPENKTAMTGLETILQTTVLKIDNLIQNDEIDKASFTLDKLQAFFPSSDKTESLQKRIDEVILARELAAEAAKAEQQRVAQLERDAEEKRQKLQSLIGKAIASFDSSRLVEPPQDNALYYYRAMLKIDPESIPATAGIAQIAASFLRESKQSLANSNFDSADRNLTTAAAIDPENVEIPLLRSQIDTQRKLAEQERKALEEAELRRAEAETAANHQLQINLQAGIEAYYNGSYIESYNYLKPLSDKGVARAQFRVAMMHEYGRGVEPNKAESRKLFLVALEPIRELATSDVAWAQADLGSYYEDGIIIDQDYKTAAGWYYQAAELGYSGAQTNLGVLFANGHGVNPDMKKAVEWFKRAALQGDRVAKENLTILGYDPEKIILGE